MLEAFGPITRGKLLGLEVVLSGVEAAEDLRMIANMSTAFGGGKEAKRYVRTLHERLHAAPAFLAALRDPEGRRAAKRSEIETFAAGLAAIEARTPRAADDPPHDPVNHLGGRPCLPA